MPVSTTAGSGVVRGTGTRISLDSNVTPVVPGAVTSAAAVDVRTSVITKVEAGSVVPAEVKIIVTFPVMATLSVGVIVDGGIIELYIDVTTIVVVLVKVEAALVVV
jgi:hypothetical protein